jgi:peptide/nickel transport system substrate-binding protein
MAPTKFFEFREALAMAINYQEIEALTTLGEKEPQIHAETTAESHANRAPNDMLYEQGNGSVSGDEEAARQVLSDAGWGWDNNGNLHYPPDADLSPRWEAEGNPDPDDYPCLNEDDEYVRPEEGEVDLPIDIDQYID